MYLFILLYQRFVTEIGGLRSSYRSSTFRFRALPDRRACADSAGDLSDAFEPRRTSPRHGCETARPAIGEPRAVCGSPGPENRGSGWDSGGQRGRWPRLNRPARGPRPNHWHEPSHLSPHDPGH